MNSVWALWYDPGTYEDCPRLVGLFTSEAIAEAAREAIWAGHTPSYFGGRKEFDRTHLVEGPIEVTSEPEGAT